MPIAGADPALALARANFEKAASVLDLHPPGAIPAGAVPTSELRRGRRFSRTAPVGSISLFERDGMLVWQLGTLASPRQRELRQRVPRRGLPGILLGRKEFVALGQNEIGRYLSDLDAQLTPGQGLWKWNAQTGACEPAGKLNCTGRVLLFIHGTFSKCEHLLEDIAAAPGGPQLLQSAAAAYSHILVFNHATISVSPMLNALDLRNALAEAGVTGPVDIVCHSRGGLVARWWMEVLDSAPGRAKRCVFVASPLNGTNLASPTRLRNGLNALATFSKLLGTASMAVPFMTGAAAILRVIGSVGNAASRVPLVDAALAMIPGINGQSRITNNPELLRLNKAAQNLTAYHFVRSNFQSPDPGWRIWQYVSGTLRLAEAAADLLIFPGQNDLVVDTESMTEVLGLLPLAEATNLLDFGTSGTVHHTNYFRQRETIDFLGRTLVAAP